MREPIMKTALGEEKAVSRLLCFRLCLLDFPVKPPCEKVGIFFLPLFCCLITTQTGEWNTRFAQTAWLPGVTAAEEAVFSEFFHLVYCLSLWFKYRHEPSVSLQRQLTRAAHPGASYELCFRGQEAGPPSLKPPAH